MLVTQGVYRVAGPVRARQTPPDVGRATVLGLLGTLIIYILISVLSGVMNQPQLVARGAVDGLRHGGRCRQWGRW